MSDNYIELTEDEFDTSYPLKSNHLNPSAGWALGDAGGCLFETHGEEFAFVMRQDPRTVWTLLNGDDGDMYLLNGLHLVNRVGYLLSTIPAPDNVTIQVRLPMSKDVENDLVETAHKALREPRSPASFADTGHSRTILGELPPPSGKLTRFDDYEISPCRRFEEPDSPGRFYFEVCEPAEADVWTLYGHIPGQGVEAIGDFNSFDHAAEVYSRITGRPYA